VEVVMDRHRPSTNVSLIACFTAAVWCVVVGAAIAQFVIPAKPAEKPEDRKDAVLLAIRVSLQSPAASVRSPVPPQPAAPAVAVPEPVRPLPIPEAPALLPVLPAPAVRPRPFVAARRSAAFASTPAAPPAAAGVPVYQAISYGTGAGVQPAPEYPDEAQYAGQEGTVVVRFKVDAEGRVTEVVVAKPCTWPLLNVAAARSIRDTWSYPAGPPRYYEIGIVYRGKQPD
jgi:protein TonB